MPKPSWCTKPSPCDYDEGSNYCPHRECRRNLESILVETEMKLDLAQEKLDEMAPTHKSEFERDPGRICRTKGHSWRVPHPHSSYHDRKPDEEICIRCGTWKSDVDPQPGT